MNVIDNKQHLFYMDMALSRAKAGLECEEVPVGAIVVSGDGEILSKTHNQAEGLRCQTGHAEVLAISEACKKVGGWRLEGCSIYVTLEPCLMCFGLISLSRLNALYFGAKSPLFGCGLDNPESFPLYKKALIIEGGIKRDESAALLRLFFERRRKEKR